MIIEYEKRYEKQVKALLRELQEYIVSIDREGFNIITPGYEEKYFEKTMQEVAESNGKMLLCVADGRAVGLVVGLVSEAVEEYDFRAPKRGRVTELIVSKACRAKGIGKSLLDAIEQFFKQQGCKNIVIEVFGYNAGAIAFYERNGYHTRVIDTTKNID